MNKQDTEIILMMYSIIDRMASRDIRKFRRPLAELKASMEAGIYGFDMWDAARPKFGQSDSGLSLRRRQIYQHWMGLTKKQRQMLPKLVNLIAAAEAKGEAQRLNLAKGERQKVLNATAASLAKAEKLLQDSKLKHFEEGKRAERLAAEEAKKAKSILENLNE